MSLYSDRYSYRECHYVVTEHYSTHNVQGNRYKGTEQTAHTTHTMGYLLLQWDGYYYNGLLTLTQKQKHPTFT